MRSWWPGQFFYRAGGIFQIPDGEIWPGCARIWGWPYSRLDKYFLGVYGSLSSEGLDVIRLTTMECQSASVQSGSFQGAIDGQYYQDNSDPSHESSHPDFNILVQYSNPEVFGGGARGLMPQFPYYESGTNAFLYGAPDGYPDGIILTITDTRNLVEY
jgi:hypothetical protein